MNGCLTQFRVLGLGGDQDGDIWVGVFPGREKGLVCRGRVGSVVGNRIGPRELKLGERSGHKISHDALVIEQLLEFDGRGRATVYAQESLAA